MRPSAFLSSLSVLACLIATPACTTVNPTSTTTAAPADAGFAFKTQPVDLNFRCEGQTKNQCASFKVELLDSNNAWANQWINGKVTGDSANPMAGLERRAHLIGKESAESVRVGSPPYETIVQLKDMGTHRQLTQVQMIEYAYTGGAHGMTVTSNYLLDTQARQVVRLNDMVESGKMDALTDLLMQQYEINAKTKLGNTTPQQLKEYFASWPFSMTDNVRFTPQGLAFDYQPYDLAAYAYGLQTLTVPHAQLKGILKPEFL